MSVLSFVLRFNLIIKIVLYIIIFPIMVYLLQICKVFFSQWWIGGVLKKARTAQRWLWFHTLITCVIDWIFCSDRNGDLDPFHSDANHLWSVEFVFFLHRILFMASCRPLTLSLPPPLHRGQLLPRLSSAPEYSQLPVGSGIAASSYDSVCEFSMRECHSSGASERL